VFTFDLDWGQGLERIESTLWSLTTWERKFDRKITSLTDGIGMDELFHIAHTTLIQQGADVPKGVDQFIQKLVSFEIISDTEPTGPTK